MSCSRAVAIALVWLVPAVSSAAAPVRVVEASLPVPEGLELEDALASVGDVAAIFERYEPVIPRVPGVRMALDKQVVSAEAPTVMELPIEGSAFGRDIVERARVSASSQPVLCDQAVEGRVITLDFQASSYNIERRIDRIEITACPRIDDDGALVVDAVGRMFAGFLPEDPELNGLSEAIGSRALQSAFIKQVPAVFSAVEAHWSEQLRVTAPG